MNTTLQFPIDRDRAEGLVKRIVDESIEPSVIEQDRVVRSMTTAITLNMLSGSPTAALMGGVVAALQLGYALAAEQAEIERLTDLYDQST